MIDFSTLNWIDWVGILGALTGLPALIIQFFQYIHLKPKIRVEITPECIILRNEFKVCSTENGVESASYRYASHAVISNVGQMAATILSIKVIARNYRYTNIPASFLRKLLKNRFVEVSNPDNTFVDQTYKTPFVINSGHSWLTIMDLELFRQQIKQFPFVYFIVKSSHKKKPDMIRISLKANN